jgi:putative copper export protein
MLSLAALNRFVLVPALASDVCAARTRFRLSFSIVLDLFAALAILAIASRLGLLDPAAG